MIGIARICSDLYYLKATSAVARKSKVATSDKVDHNLCFSSNFDRDKTIMM